MDSSLKVILLFVLLGFLTCQSESSPDKQAPVTPRQQWKLICLGDDVIIGREMEPENAFPARLERLLTISTDVKVKVVNAGIKGETSAGANERVEWILQQRFDAILVATGLNDPLGPQVMEERQAMIAKIRNAHPNALILASHTNHHADKGYISDKIAGEYEVELLDLPLQPSIPEEEQEKIAEMFSKYIRTYLP